MRSIVVYKDHHAPRDGWSDDTIEGSLATIVTVGGEDVRCH